MGKIYIEKIENEVVTSNGKKPKKELIDSILNFSKSYKVSKSKHLGQMEMVLN